MTKISSLEDARLIAARLGEDGLTVLDISRLLGIAERQVQGWLDAEPLNRAHGPFEESQHLNMS